MRWGCVLIGLLLAPGCVVVDLEVVNPIPGLSKVAVVPFYNLSPEPAADGYRFAEAYFAELQKVPGFQVLPIGVTEAAIQDNKLNMQSPADAVRLANLLNVDAVVVGAITDYDPYYPPRAGWQVSWYSPHSWEFSPGLPTEPSARKAILEAGMCPDEDCEPPLGVWGRTKAWFKRHYRAARAEHATVFRGQSEATFPPRPALPQNTPPNPYTAPAPPRPLIPPHPNGQQPPANPPAASYLPPAPDAMEAAPPAPLAPPVPPPDVRYEPLMSYTRIFDGTDADLMATLRDYVELRDDLRAGYWQGWLYRTDDFLRFTAHRMIVEMLALHGGEARRRVVFVWRKQK